MARTEEKIHQREIANIKHKNKKIWVEIYSNPLSFFLIVAFFATAWFFHWDFRMAAGQSLTYLLEWFVIKHFDKKGRNVNPED